MGAEEFKRYFALNLGVSGAAAAFLVILGFGAYSLVVEGNGLDIWAITLSVLLGAVIFVAASTYQDSQGYHHEACVLWGALAAALTMVLALSFWLTVAFFAESSIGMAAVPYIVLSYALAMIASSSAIWVLRGRQERHTY